MPSGYRKPSKKQCLEDIKKYQDLTRECKRFYRESEEQELRHYREEIAKLQLILEKHLQKEVQSGQR
tara:strand:- start:55 stop:255 length:201 start_codon:yes stop_codon:yes gene_type:complete